MTGSRIGIWKHILFHVLLLACLSIPSCTSLEVPRVAVFEQGARGDLAAGQTVFAQHDYEASLIEFETALSLSGKKPPGDEALLAMGMVYVDPENPKRNCPKSIATFQRLAKEYPESNLAQPARIWAEILEEQERLERAMSETLQDNENVKRLWNDARRENERLKRLSNETAQENQRLKDMMEQSKAVDVEVKEKKKGRGE